MDVDLELAPSSSQCSTKQARKNSENERDFGADCVYNPERCGGAIAGDARGKSGLHRAEWSITSTDRMEFETDSVGLGKVPQKTDRQSLWLGELVSPSSREGKGETVR